MYYVTPQRYHAAIAAELRFTLYCTDAEMRERSQLGVCISNEAGAWRERRGGIEMAWHRREREK